MPWLAPLAAAGTGIASGLIARGTQQDAIDAAARAYQESVDDLAAIGIPSIEAQKIVAEEYKSQGQWTPELEEAVSQGDTALGGITTDPTYKESQLKALGKLQQIGDEGGHTLEDKANLERTLGGIASKQRGAREAILQDSQQRGGYGSGTALAAQLMAQQGGAQEAHQVGLDTAAQAQSRALQAIQSAGSMGTNLRNQEFDEKERVAKARDQISQWNAANRQDTMSRNVGTKNAAAQYNLSNAQNLSNANVDTRNKTNLYNTGLQQQKFNNELEIAKSKAGARSHQAQNTIQAGNQAAATIAGIGKGVGEAAIAGGQAYQSQENRRADRELMLKRYNGDD